MCGILAGGAFTSMTPQASAVTATQLQTDWTTFYNNYNSFITAAVNAIGYNGLGKMYNSAN